MTRSRFSGIKGVVAVLAASMAVAVLVACNGPTRVDGPEGVENYRVQVSMDPPTLNPPQIGTISYTLTDTRNGKPVTEFTKVFGALFHNILISRDLLHFKHSYTSRVVLDSVSLQTYFPVTGKYNSYGIFRPKDADVYVYPHTIQAGDEGAAPDLVEDARRSKATRQFGLQLDLMTGPEPLRAGQDAQIAVYVTELGRPVTGLWPFLDAPGYLWIVDEEGQNFTWEEGTSPAHMAPSRGTVEPSPTSPTRQATVPPTLPPPTLVPDLQSLLATRTAQPAPTLAPVQQTAQASVLEPQAVQPSVTYGPYVVFGHRFPKAGLYKVWFEFQYRGQPILSDWVLEVHE